MVKVLLVSKDTDISYSLTNSWWCPYNSRLKCEIYSFFFKSIINGTDELYWPIQISICTNIALVNHSRTLPLIVFILTLKCGPSVVISTYLCIMSTFITTGLGCKDMCWRYYPEINAYSIKHTLKWESKSWKKLGKKTINFKQSFLICKRMEVPFQDIDFKKYFVLHFKVFSSTVIATSGFTSLAIIKPSLISQVNFHLMLNSPKRI